MSYNLPLVSLPGPFAELRAVSVCFCDLLRCGCPACDRRPEDKGMACGWWSARRGIRGSPSRPRAQ